MTRDTTPPAPIASFDTSVASDVAKFRQVLGQYPTGVVVVTAASATGEALGMTVGSFTSVSLDPPLVAFMPAKSSSSWRALRESGNTFCVNVLGSDQEDVCRAVAMRKADKFEGIEWRPTAQGNPVIDGAVAFIDCTVEEISDAGDHHIVVGRIQELDVENTTYPLLFFRGGYGSFAPLSLAAGDADLLEQLRLIDLARPHMEQLSIDFATEVTALTLVRNELVLAASAGRAVNAIAPTRVGRRVPLTPPLGSVLVAWGGDAAVDDWLTGRGASTPPEQVQAYRDVLARVRQRGYAVTLGHAAGARLEAVTTRLQSGDPTLTAGILRATIEEVASCYNPEMDQEFYELRSLSAPVFNADSHVAYALAIWGPPGRISLATFDDYVRGLLSAARSATAAIDGVAPS